jgi:hypothetical protein
MKRLLHSLGKSKHSSIRKKGFDLSLFRSSSVEQVNLHERGQDCLTVVVGRDTEVSAVHLVAVNVLLHFGLIVLN